MIVTVTEESAALLAQVFPTLLIALVIEARGVQGQFKTFLGYLRYAIRVIAILSSLVATFMCILVATGGGTGEPANWSVNIAFWSMFFALLIFINSTFTREINES